MSTSSESSVRAYRCPKEPARVASDGDDETFTEALHPVLLLVWVASFARVAGALYSREVLGAEATLALMTLIAVTWYAVAARARSSK
jgi:hypothetical protein